MNQLDDRLSLVFHRVSTFQPTMAELYVNRNTKMKPELHSEMILVRVTDKMKRQLQLLSDKSGAPVAYFVRSFVQSGIDARTTQ